MGTLVSANADISWAKPFASDRPLQTMSNGHLLVIYKDTGSGNLYYRTSADAGATLTAAAVLPGSPTPTGLCSVQVHNDVLYLWYTGTPSAQLYVSTYNTGTNTLGAQTVYTYTFPSVTAVTNIDAVLSVDGFWNVAIGIITGGKHSVAVFRTPGFDGLLSSYQNYLDLSYLHTGITGLRLLWTTGFLYIVWFDTAQKTLRFAPVTRTSISLTWSSANLELVTSLTDVATTFDVVLEIGGQVTFVIAHTNLLYSLARTGLKTYGGMVALQGQIDTGVVPSTLLDTATLYVGFETQVNQPDGETYILKRSGSVWALPAVLAGGSSGGFTAPVLQAFSLLYQDTTNRLWYLGWASESAPLAPTALAPTGTISTLTPTLTWKSNPSAPTDPTKSHQVQTIRVSDSHLMDDSGEVFDGTTSYNVPGGAGLVSNIAYAFQVREKDSLSALGAGTWGPYSTLATFTPVRSAVATITTVTSGGVTHSSFPATITGADLQAHVTYTQPDSDPTNAYRLVLFAADDTTQVAASTYQPLGPTIPSGGNFDTIDWVPLPGAIVNTNTYHLAVEVADATTGVLSYSNHVQLTVNVTPPGIATGLTTVVDHNAGTVTLAWTNGAGTATVLIEWQPYSETGKPLGWRSLGPTGQLWNHVVSVAQAPQCIADYRVTCVNAFGISSASVSSLGVFLDNALDYAGIWVNDVNDPLGRKVFIGYIDNWDSLKRDRAYDIQEWVAMGASLPTQTFGLMSYWILGTSNALKLFLPAVDVDESGNPYYGADTRDMMISMADSHSVLLYRDRRFPVPIYVRFFAYEDQPNEDVNTDTTLELHQTAYFAPFPVVGSLV